MDRPYTLRRGSTLVDAAALIHEDFAEKLKYARAWGNNIHDALVVKADYVVEDCDIFEIHT